MLVSQQLSATQIYAHAWILAHTYLNIQHRWELETLTTSYVLYEIPASQAITMLTTKLIAKWMVHEEKSLILLQRTSLKTHILCDTAVIASPSTCQPWFHKCSCGHIRRNPQHNNTPFLCTAVLGSGSAGEQRYLSPCGCGRSAEAPCLGFHVTFVWALGVFYRVENSAEKDIFSSQPWQQCSVKLQDCSITQTLPWVSADEQLLFFCLSSNLLLICHSFIILSSPPESPFL